MPRCPVCSVSGQHDLQEQWSACSAECVTGRVAGGRLLLTEEQQRPRGPRAQTEGAVWVHENRQPRNARQALSV